MLWRTKKLVIISILLLAVSVLVSPVVAQEMELVAAAGDTAAVSVGYQLPSHYIYGDMDGAISIARKEHKEIIAIFRSDWDKYSKRLDIALKDGEVAKLLSKFVVVILTLKKDEKIFDRYGVRGLPETLLIADEDNVKGRFRGIINVKNYLSDLKKLILK